MTEHPDIFPVPAELAKEAQIDAAKYQEWYERSIKDPEGFWGEHGKRIDWIKPFTQVKDSSFDEGDLHIKWFHDGTLNVAAPGRSTDRGKRHRSPPGLQGLGVGPALRGIADDDLHHGAARHDV